MADKEKSRGLSVKLDVDVSEALTGLKAVQREAKKAAQALREVEAAQAGGGLSQYTTKELTDELAGRSGVTYRKKSDLVEGIPKGFTLVVVDD